MCTGWQACYDLKRMLQHCVWKKSAQNQVCTYVVKQLFPKTDRFVFYNTSADRFSRASARLLYLVLTRRQCRVLRLLKYAATCNRAAAECGERRVQRSPRRGMNRPDIHANSSSNGRSIRPQSMSIKLASGRRTSTSHEEICTAGPWLCGDGER